MAEGKSSSKGPTLSITNVLLMKEAESRGWKTRVLNLAQDMCLLFPPNEKEILIRRATTELTTALGAVIAHDKNMTYTMAEYAGVPYPVSMMFNDQDWASAIAFVTKYKHCVVKPTDRAHGDGVSTEVTNEASLRTAITHALKFSTNIVIQEWVDGVDYRILVLNDRVIAAARRRPAFVKGDGVSTIAQLIATKNLHPWRGSGHTSPLTKIDINEVDTYLKSTPTTTTPTGPAHATATSSVSRVRSLTDVLEKDHELECLGTANLSRGGEAIDVTDQMHPDTAALAVKLASACQLGLAGVDFRLTDITAPPVKSRPRLLEVNLTPGLRMHHYPGVGTPRNASGMILDEILRRRKLAALAKSLSGNNNNTAAATTTVTAAMTAAAASTSTSAATSSATTAAAAPATAASTKK